MTSTGVPMQQDQSLNFKDVRISLNERVLVEISTCIEPGEILTLMGPSGSGKSSLLAYAAGFLDKAFNASGKIFLQGSEISTLPPERRRIGLLFQDALLFPHMSVGGNLAFAIPRHVESNSQRRRQMVDEALADAGLAGMADRDPATLSGGQQSRVALMRVLLAQPKALLLDEPFSKLDVERRGKMRDFVFTNARSRMLPVLLVTHDPADTMAANGPVIELAD